MAQQRVVVYSTRERRDADILIMQLSRAGIQAAKDLGEESDQRPRWQVSVARADEYQAREVVGQLEQDRRDVSPSDDESGRGFGVDHREGGDWLHNPTTVYSARSGQEAHFLKNLLIESGIHAMVSNDVLQRGIGVEIVGLPTAPKVVVAAKDAEVARELALEFDRRATVPTDPEVFYNATSLREAQAVSEALTQSGISAAIGDEILPADAQSDSVVPAGTIPVLINRRDAEAARQIVFSGFHSRAVSSQALAGMGIGESVIAVPAPWPRCPQCDTRRTTRCPICATSGTEFEEVDPDFAGSLGLPDLPHLPALPALPANTSDASDTTGGCGSNCSCSKEPQSVETGAVETEAEPSGVETAPPRLALMCSTCDEPFVPDFPSRCEWCGHEFADGYQVEEHLDREPIPAQAMVVILGLVALVLVACAYFAWIV